MTTVDGPRVGRHRAGAPGDDGTRGELEPLPELPPMTPRAATDTPIPITGQPESRPAPGRVRDAGYRPQEGYRAARGYRPEPQYRPERGRGAGYRPQEGYRPARGYRPEPQYRPEPGPGTGYRPQQSYRPAPQYRPEPSPTAGYQPQEDYRPARDYRPEPQRRPEPGRGAGYRPPDDYRPARAHPAQRDSRPEPGPRTDRNPRQLDDFSSADAYRNGERGTAVPPASRPSAAQPLLSAALARVQHLVLLAIGGALLLVVIGLGLGAHLVHRPNGSMHLAFGSSDLRYVIYAVWMIPVVELALLLIGQLNNRYRFKYAPPGSFEGMIIQITTTGREQDRVNEIIAQIHGYRLPLRYQLWVVTEPGQRDHYPLADRVIVVPADFVARSERKARALEYSRRVRISLGFDRADIKVLFNDDDVAPTRGYIEKAFAADYDICEGVTSPRTEYGVRPLGHFLASHADDMRTHACLVYCSVFQGILGSPLHVHGEGLTVTGAAESAITWDWPAFASEDLVFGQRAAKAGLRWGWFHEYVELTSPWTIRDFLIQRRRWLWGDIHAIVHREVLSLRGAIMVAGKYLFGLITLAFSVGGLWLRLTGRLPGDSSVYNLAKLSVVAWLAVFFACGWIGAGSRVSRRTNDSRLLQAATAVLLLPATSALTLAGVLIPFIQGNPRTFQVIRKTRQGAR